MSPRHVELNVHKECVRNGAREKPQLRVFIPFPAVLLDLSLKPLDTEAIDRIRTVGRDGGKAQFCLKPNLLHFQPLGVPRKVTFRLCLFWRCRGLLPTREPCHQQNHEQAHRDDVPLHA